NCSIIITTTTTTAVLFICAADFAESCLTDDAITSINSVIATPLSTPERTSRYPTRDRCAPSRLNMNPHQKSYVVDETNLIICCAELSNEKFQELFIGVTVSGVKVPQNYAEAVASPESESWLKETQS